LLKSLCWELALEGLLAEQLKMKNLLLEELFIEQAITEEPVVGGTCASWTGSWRSWSLKNLLSKNRL
jgi:hypothetical protein